MLCCIGNHICQQPSIHYTTNNFPNIRKLCNSQKMIDHFVDANCSCRTFISYTTDSSSFTIPATRFIVTPTIPIESFPPGPLHFSSNCLLLPAVYQLQPSSVSQSRAPLKPDYPLCNCPKTITCPGSLTHVG